MKSTRNPRETMTKKELALAVIERLKKAYPDAHCTLAYEDAWQLLISFSYRILKSYTGATVPEPDINTSFGLLSSPAVNK